MSNEQRIQRIIDNFDFEKVHKAMAAVGWFYFDTFGQTPSIERLKATAKSLFRNLDGKKCVECRAGGFIAAFDEDGPALSFCLTSMDEELLLPLYLEEIANERRHP